MKANVLSAVLACLFAVPLSAQRVVPTFSAYKATALVAGAETVTIQQPATGGKQTRFVGADVYCEVACVLTLKQNGTAATGTAITPVVLTRGASVVNGAFHTANVGAGTTIRTIDVAAGTTVSIDLSNIYMDGSNTARNFSIATNSITGDVKIYIVWRED